MRGDCHPTNKFGSPNHPRPLKDIRRLDSCASLHNPRKRVNSDDQSHDEEHQGIQWG